MDKKQQQQEDLERLQELRLFEDEFMNACFDQNIEGAELILRIILGKPDIIVKQVTTQRMMQNLLGRSVRLDIAAEDADGKVYDIEVQRAEEGARPKRARYHSSIMDSHLLEAGEDFEDLPETYVIFITESDYFKEDKPIYTIERMITGLNRPFGDEEHIIYVNGANRDSGTEIGRLMHDFSCTDPDEMYYKELAKVVRYFKKDEEGVRKMSGVLEEMRNEVAKETEEETNMKAIKNIMKSLKLSEEQAMDALKIPKKERKLYMTML